MARNWINFIVDVGSVASAEEAFDKAGRTRIFSALLDKKVRLDNGDEVTFRDEIERALRRMQVNDGFLLQFVPRPAVEEDVAACGALRRSPIRSCPQWSPQGGQERSGEEAQAGARAQEAARRDRPRAGLIQAGDPAKMENFMPSGVWIMPLSTQTEEWTVLNLLGL